nr:hypothetical protein [uncultured Porphyromonas sp.]
MDRKPASRQALPEASRLYSEVLAILLERVRLYYIGDPASSVAPHWYIRHGARDRDTAFPVIINLATKLENTGRDVNFKLPWNRPHSGDYALNELFAWVRSITR